MKVKFNKCQKPNRERERDEQAYIDIHLALHCLLTCSHREAAVGYLSSGILVTPVSMKKIDSF